MKKDGFIYKSLRYFYHKTPIYKKKVNQNSIPYKGLDKDIFLKQILEYDIISFDIFDTLLTRCLYEPDDLFVIMSEKLNDKDFFYKRKNAEHEANIKYHHDVSLDEIYETYKELYQLSKNEVEKIKKMEIDFELQFIVPRKEMLDVFNTLIAQKKYVILTSDMYLNKEYIEKMLTKCGYHNYKKLYVSNDINKRKDKKDIWPYILKNHKNKKIVHIGDNKNSDFLFPKEFEIDTIKIESSKELLKMSTLYDNISGFIDNRSMSDSIYLGIIFNKTVFNSPFSNLTIDLLEDFSYVFHGPIINEYMKFICENTKKDSHLLFLAREGYNLQKIYKYYVKKYKLKELKNNYFLTSRKSTTLSSITKEEQFEELIKNEYVGSIKNFFKNNLEIEYLEEDYQISLPNDKEKVLKELLKYEEEILKEAKEERENYIQYVFDMIPNYKKEDIILIDLGYSGTIQYNLTRMLKKEVTGLYVTNSNKIKKYSEKSKLLFLFNNNENEEYIKLFNYSLILEYFLIAPYGQLQRFEQTKNGLKPVYNEEKLDAFRKKAIETIYESVKTYIDDVAAIDKQYKLDFNKDLLCRIYTCLIEGNHLNREVKDQFNYMDSFCRDKEINIFKTISRY